MAPDSLRAPSGIATALASAIAVALVVISLGGCDLPGTAKGTEGGATSLGSAARPSGTAPAAVTALCDHEGEAPDSSLARSPGRIWHLFVDPPRGVQGNEGSTVEVGSDIRAISPSLLVGIRFYTVRSRNQPTDVAVWTPIGDPVVRVRTCGAQLAGWNTVTFSDPVPLPPGRALVISYTSRDDSYLASPRYFLGRAHENGLVSVPRGVFGVEPGAVPRRSWQQANYWVEPLAVPDRTPSSLPLTEVDGGNDFYRRFWPSLPSEADFFPIAVWAASVTSTSEVDHDRSLGINTYIRPNGDSDLSLLDEGGGMFALHDGVPGAEGSSAGWVLADEPDMWAGPGDAKWTGSWPGQGPRCEPVDQRCGYDVQRSLGQRLASGGDGLLYANYGKGVLFWETDKEASRFVNEFQDVVSADAYWFTDRDVCHESQGGGRLAGRSLTPAECALAANYGWTIDRVRSLVEPERSKPVWAVVEVGHPFSQSEWERITSDGIQAAVWSSLIHGARGIVYFNHSFGGACPSLNVLRSDCAPEVQDTVRRLNAQIHHLAPVLNAPFLEWFAFSDAQIDVMAKTLDGDAYLFAASASPKKHRGEVDIGVRCAGDEAEVLYEGRSLPIVDGQISDGFADPNTVHIYRFPGCGN